MPQGLEIFVVVPLPAALAKDAPRVVVQILQAHNATYEIIVIPSPVASLSHRHKVTYPRRADWQSRQLRVLQRATRRPIDSITPVSPSRKATTPSHIRENSDGPSDSQKVIKRHNKFNSQEKLWSTDGITDTTGRWTGIDVGRQAPGQ
ncbi:hypothetical protein B0H14DRAFT_2617926 [Mycena olivaceomarginata]|nr:hypothetical protein B0H14DRAFT_2617926 [Mycena olivaceomarginata]